MAIKTVAISDIKVGKRLRPVDKSAVKQLADSIGQVGLLQPIVLAEVDDELHLIAGRHRLEAVKRNGGETIKAEVFKGLSRDEIAIREIDENLSRHNLSAAEEAQWLKRRIELWDRMNAESNSSSDKAKPVKAMSIREVAKKTGKGKDEVHRAVSRAKALGDDVLDDVKGTKLDKGSALDDLSKVAKSKGKDAAKELVAKAKRGEKVDTKAEAKAVTTPKQKDKDKRRASAIKALRKVCDEYDDVRELSEICATVAALETEYL